MLLLLIRTTSQKTQSIATTKISWTHITVRIVVDDAVTHPVATTDLVGSSLLLMYCTDFLFLEFNCILDLVI